MRPALLRFTVSIVAVAALLGNLPIHASDVPAPASIARGRAILAGAGRCLSCHRVADQGSYMGPDLSTIGTHRSSEQIRAAILSPNADVSAENSLYRVVTRRGETITGRLLNQDTNILQMLTSDSLLVTLRKSDLRSFDFTKTPPMPSFRGRLTAAGISDLVTYLSSLDGVVKQ